MVKSNWMGFVLYCHKPFSDKLAVDRICLGTPERIRFFKSCEKCWINFHEAVVSVLKEEFQVQGIMSSGFKPYSYVLGISEGEERVFKKIKTLAVVSKGKLRNDMLVSCRENAAIVFVL